MADIAELTGWHPDKGGTTTTTHEETDKAGDTVMPDDVSPSGKGRPDAVETHSDEPTAEDRLGRRYFAQALVERMDDVRRKGGSDGFAVHLHGPWGAGKTSILMMMQEFMRSSERDPEDRWAVVDFNAWRHERRNPPWWPLLEAVKAGCSQSLRRDGNWVRSHDVEARWFGWRFIADLFPMLLGLSVLAFLLWVLKPDISSLWSGSAQSDDSSGLDRLESIVKVVSALVAAFGAFVLGGRAIVFGSANNAKFYHDLSKDPLRRISGLFKTIIRTTNQPVCIFIDDLDRCRADYVVDLLEGIQTSFRSTDVAYVIAADRNWIKASFEEKYGTFSDAIGDTGQPLGYLFLEKIFQVSTPVPGMGEEIQKSYWQSLLTTKGAEKEGQPDRDELERVKEESDRKVEAERKTIQLDHPEGLTRGKADALLAREKSPEMRAAVLLELNASRVAEKEAEHLLMQFVGVVPDNPRVMKRMVNAFAMHQAIGILEDSQVSTETLARWTILEQRFPALADLLIRDPEWIVHVAKQVADDRLEKLPEPIRPFANSEVIRRIIGKTGPSRLVVENVRTITRGAAA